MPTADLKRHRPLPSRRCPASRRRHRRHEGRSPIPPSPPASRTQDRQRPTPLRRSIAKARFPARSRCRSAGHPDSIGRRCRRQLRNHRSSMGRRWRLVNRRLARRFLRPRRRCIRRRRSANRCCCCWRLANRCFARRFLHPRRRCIRRSPRTRPHSARSAGGPSLPQASMPLKPKTSKMNVPSPHRNGSKRPPPARPAATPTRTPNAAVVAAAATHRPPSAPPGGRPDRASGPPAPPHPRPPPAWARSGRRCRTPRPQRAASRPRSGPTRPAGPPIEDPGGANQRCSCSRSCLHDRPDPTPCRPQR